MDKELPVSAWPEWKIIERSAKALSARFIKRSAQNGGNLSIQQLRSSIFPEARAN